VTFTPDGIRQLASYAMRVNEQTENIGARRLHTVLERLLEEVSFNAPEDHAPLVVDEAFVKHRLESIVENDDLRTYIL